MEGSNESSRVSKEVCEVKHHSVEDRLADLEKKIDKQESKLNGFIMAIVTAIIGTAAAVAGDLIKEVVKLIYGK